MSSESAAERIEQIATKEGSQKGFEALKADYNSFTRNHGGDESPASQRYWSDLSTRLERAQVLPNLALGWGLTNMDVYTKEDGLTRSDLSKIQNREWPNRTFIDVTMSSILLKQFDKIKSANEDSEGGFLGIGSHEKDAITHGDLIETIDQRANRHAARMYIQRFLQTEDGNAMHSLYGRLDAAPGGKIDGKVGLEDMNNYLKQFQYRKGAGLLENLDSDEHSQAVREATLVQNLKDAWDTTGVRRLRGVSHYERSDTYGHREKTVYNDLLSLDRLVELGGYQSKADMLAAQAIPRTVTSSEPPVNSTSVRNAIEQRMFDAGIRQTDQEGPYQAAQRILPNARHKDVLDLAHALKRSYQVLNNDRSDTLERLPAGFRWLRPDNLQEVLQNSSALRKRVDSNRV